MEANIDLLFIEYKMGSIILKNRIAMAPMTRARADKGGLANDMMATYYSQRANAGLIVTESTDISQQGQSSAWTAGIYNNEQVKAWKKVTDAVHAKGGRIFCQLLHAGRVSHSSLQPDNHAPVSSTDKPAEGIKVFIDPHHKGHDSGEGVSVETSTPVALTIPEMKGIIEQYKKAAQNAIDAGFDGVEIHAANGFLINQFIDSHPNTRTDEYGGSIQNRLRFLSEVVSAVVSQIGGEFVGVRLKPFVKIHDCIDDTPEETYLQAAKLLNDLGVAYLHIVEFDFVNPPATPESFYQKMRDVFYRTLIYNGDYDKDRAMAIIDKGYADLIAFGRKYIANPDLVDRLKHDYPLAEGDPNTYYGGNAKGYTDYPNH